MDVMTLNSPHQDGGVRVTYPSLSSKRCRHTGAITHAQEGQKKRWILDNKHFKTTTEFIKINPFPAKEKCYKSIKL